LTKAKDGILVEDAESEGNGVINLQKLTRPDDQEILTPGKTILVKVFASLVEQTFTSFVSTNFEIERFFQN